MKKIKLTFILLLIISPILSNAQSFGRIDQLGLNVGGAYYLGDYNNIPFKQITPSLGLFYRYNVDKRFSVRPSLNYIKIKGENNSIPQLQYNNITSEFEQNIYDINVVGEFNFIPYIPCHNQYTFTPYLFAGVGVNILQDSEHVFQLVAPFGVGIKYTISQNFTLDVESSFYKTFSDFIDMDYIVPTEKNISYINRQQYYHGSKDWYSVVCIKLSYSIKLPEKCVIYQ